MTSVFTTLSDEHTWDVPRFVVPFDRASIWQLIEWFETNGHACTQDMMFRTKEAVHVGLSWAAGPAWRIDIYFRQYIVKITDEPLATAFVMRWS